MYLSHPIIVSSTHSCSGLSTPDSVCFYSTSRHTQYGVHSTPRVLCPEWQMLECSTHPLRCVLYTRCRAAHYSPECALDTAEMRMLLSINTFSLSMHVFAVTSMQIQKRWGEPERFNHVHVMTAGRQRVDKGVVVPDERS